MARSIFVYVTYIRTTPEELWSALTKDVEFMKQYWFGVHCESQWTRGSRDRIFSTAHNRALASQPRSSKLASGKTKSAVRSVEGRKSCSGPSVSYRKSFYRRSTLSTM